MDEQGEIVAQTPPSAFAGLDFDVCLEGSIFSEHGDDAAAAVAEAARLRLEGDYDVVTILVTSPRSRGEA